MTEVLREHRPSLEVETIMSRDALLAAVASDRSGTRLISFCSAVVVPGDVLTALGTPSYNFHPGPPEYPGRYPSVFALYEGAERFGITVHEMAAKVDAGPIISAEWFPIPKDCSLEKLEELAFSALVAKFRVMAHHLATIERPLPRMPYRWSGRKTKKADCTALCRITPGLDADEIARRRRACGGHLVEG
ncbi:MAG: formyltransferase family protein [Rhodospirillaceae bacterium]|nr:formyltransferase family protein [Rhodospirillaceae bacterium]